MKFVMFNKNGCGQGCGLSIGACHVGVVIMVPETISKKLRPMGQLGTGSTFMTGAGVCM